MPYYQKTFLSKYRYVEYILIKVCSYKHHVKLLEGKK